MRFEQIGSRSQPLQHRENIKSKAPTESNSIEEHEQKPKDEKRITTEEVETVVSKLNEFMEPERTNLKFELHDKLDKYYVKVVNTSTDEVVKEIPPEKMLDMYAAMAEFMGFLVDEKV
ncbi:flagellar protein FlaG [Virgibacillus byunsanensis]|uniref:Flagellar protein FlaG n=1 Tax=Virgibacillus byunsanensis TaxID=570945 RepID=A0ABW3LN94_9BACI